MPMRYVTDDQLALASVVTKAQACRMWNKARSQVDMEIDKDRLQYKKQGRNVLISVASLYRRWGNPIYPQ